MPLGDLHAQDPVTAGLLGQNSARHNHHEYGSCDSATPVTAAALLWTASADFPASSSAGNPRRYVGSCAQELRREKEMRRELEEALMAERRENQQLREQIRRQFKDLEELEGILGKLETQVDGNEAIIRQQSLRIQNQEETVMQLNQRLQQYLATLIESAYKTQF